LKLPYNKSHLTYQQQIELLESRGLVIGNEAYALTKLSHINYFRLSAYFRYFYTDENDVLGEHRFVEGTTFESAVRFYYFDKALRQLIFSALEKIEVYVRTQFAYHTSADFGVFGYADAVHMYVPERHADIMEKVGSEVKRSKELFVRHFYDKYDDEHLPVWAAVEIISFNTLSRLFGNLKERQQKKIIASLKIPPFVFRSWLHALTVVRNMCAHHSRVWNKTLGVRPVKPRNNAAFASLENEKIFFVLTIIQYLLVRINDDEMDFRSDLKALLEQYPEIPLEKMGFPTEKIWTELDIWKEK
jgi:abortive infection bacteriophage resistance protein